MKLPRTPVILLIALAAACVPPEVNLSDFTFECADDVECPAAYRCGVEGACVPIEPLWPTPPGGGGGDDEPGGENDGADDPMPDAVEDPDDGDDDSEHTDDPEPDAEPDGSADPDPEPDPAPDGELSAIACDRDRDCADDYACGVSGFCGKALHQCGEVISCLETCGGAEQGGGQVDDGGRGGRDDEAPDPCMADCFSRAQYDAINPLVRAMACSTRCEGRNDEECFEDECGQELRDCFEGVRQDFTCNEGFSYMQLCVLSGDMDGNCFQRCTDEMEPGQQEMDFEYLRRCAADRCGDYPGPMDHCLKNECRGELEICQTGGFLGECSQICEQAGEWCGFPEGDCMELCHDAERAPEGVWCVRDLVERQECNWDQYDRCRPGPYDDTLEDSPIHPTKTNDSAS